MQAYLKKHGPGVANHLVKVAWSLSPGKFKCEFTLQKRRLTEWCSNDGLSGDWKKNWGLWNWDVVEAFIQLRNSPEDLKAPYLEVQLSPLNQPFALVITEPRKIFAPPKELDFNSEVKLAPHLWTASLEFSLPPELQGKEVWGGFFSCLGENPREYYAVEVNPEDHPDFHRPELFFPLTEYE